MDTEETSSINVKQNVDISKIEALVTPEQLFSANIARKRRTLTKKQSSNVHSTKKETTVSDLFDSKPKEYQETSTNRSYIPESRNTITEIEKNNERLKNSQKENVPEIDLAEHNNSLHRNFLEDLKGKTGVLAKFAQNELNSFINKTKENISSAINEGRNIRRRRRNNDFKRSQSAPYQFTEEEIMEIFLRKQKTNGIQRSSSVRSITPENELRTIKQFRPEVHEFIQKRAKSRVKNQSTKIIEILDPQTKDVIHTKTIMKETVNLNDLLFTVKTLNIREIRNEYKKYKEEMKLEISRIKFLRNKCFTELFIVILYCGIGGFIFKFVEGSFENFYKCGVKRVKRDFIDLLWSKSHSMREEEWKFLARTKLRTFEEELHIAHEAGITSYSGQRSWSFLNGFVYSITVISTIGYGHIYPTTLTGRALTIVYSLIGIPLFLLALTDFGKLFTRCIKFLWSFVRRLYYTGSCRKVRKQAQFQEIFKGAQMMYDIATFRRPSAVVDPENIPPIPTSIGEDTPTTPALSNFEIDDQFNLPISVAIFILLLYIFFGAFFYGIMEGWNFFKSFYFVFISMSTIGFGDIVPRNPLCTIISIVYLVFGLALMSMCINVVQEKLSDTFKSASAKIGASMGITMAAEDGSVITVPAERIELTPIHGKELRYKSAEEESDINR